MNDSLIQQDVEKLRELYPETQVLYREVCGLLFFRYGITPTANKLYQYVRKGSMSAPAEALTRFWEELREKSRVRIEHPDLPDNLRDAAGELLGALWGQAQSAAQAGLQVFREQAQAEIKDAQQGMQLALEQQTLALQAQAQSEQHCRDLENRVLMLEKELAAEQATSGQLREQQRLAQEQYQHSQQALSEARQDFAQELDKLRQALLRSEERCEAAEKRALLEIDRERMNSQRLLKDIDKLRQLQQEQQAQQRQEIQGLQQELANVRQAQSVAETQAQAAGQQVAWLSSRLDEMRHEGLRVEQQAQQRETTLREEMLAARQRVTELEGQLTTQQQQWQQAFLNAQQAQVESAAETLPSDTPPDRA